MFVIDTHSSLPIFEQLKKQILEFISIGILTPKDQLPSVRSLATQIGVNPNTVAKAYQVLEEQGYVYTEKGIGCFISDNESDRLIKEDKLAEFSEIVLEMRKYHVQEEDLIRVITSVYKEEAYDKNTIVNKEISR